MKTPLSMRCPVEEGAEGLTFIATPTPFLLTERQWKWRPRPRPRPRYGGQIQLPISTSTATCSLRRPTVKTVTKRLTTAIRTALQRIRQHRRSNETQQTTHAPRRRQNLKDPKWQQLIAEFDTRTNSQLTTLEDETTSDRRMPAYLNPEQFALLPYVESSFMVSLTVVLWMLGRHLRLDPFLLLFYSLPNMYIAARWGLPHADRTLLCTIVVMFVSMGPLYALLYMFNTGFLTYGYTRALWYQCSWRNTLLIGSLCKALGLVLMLIFTSQMLKYNAWSILTGQVHFLLAATVSMLNRLPFLSLSGPPSQRVVSVAVAVVLALHSAYHVFCTLLMCALVLIKVAERAPLVRVPREMPFIYRLLRRAKEYD